MNEKTLNNPQIKNIKDIIIAHPNAIIVHRDKLKYMGNCKSKSGKEYYKFRHSSMGSTTYYVSLDMVIHRAIAGKFIPLDHEAFKH